MPKDINRVPTDQISDSVFNTERDAHADLARVGAGMASVHFVGDVMIDSPFMHREKLRSAEPFPASAIELAAAWPVGDGFGVVTWHRSDNVDTSQALARALTILRDVNWACPLVWQIHPRTRASVDHAVLERRLAELRCLLHYTAFQVSAKSCKAAWQKT